MSGEPLYCAWCGKELGGECECEHDAFETPLPSDEERFCEVCGIVPTVGEHCHFWREDGNDHGCAAIIELTNPEAFDEER